MKVYLVKANYSGWEDPEANGCEVCVFDSEKKAIDYMEEAIKEEIKEEKPKQMTKYERDTLIEDLTKEMNKAASELDFERAMELRDIIFELKSS